MRKVLLGLVMALATPVAREAGACGDKFLVVGRGVRQQRAQGAAHRASILLYMDRQGRLQAALRDQKVETHLKLAGHKLEPVDGRPELAARLASGRYDIVLASITEMPVLEHEVKAAPTHPFLLPVIYNPTGEELAEAEKEWSCVMKSPSTNKHYLAVIDEAMVLKRKERKP